MMAFVQISTTKTHKGQTSINKLVERGRTTGKYRLLGAGLTEVPSAVYSGEPLDGVAFWDEVPPQTLDLSRNELQNLPYELGRLTELVSLSVSHNKLTALPESLSLLTGLKNLDISHNKLSVGPAALVSLSSSLQQLACGSNQFTSLQLNHAPELVELSAEANRLETLPHGLASCSNLSKLLLSGNAFTSVTLKGLLALKELDLSSNQLEGTLDASIGALTRLQILTLRQNRLTALPKELAGCVSLSELHLGLNQISTLPEGLGELSSLSVLDVRNNMLRNFPVGACRLSLSLLDLSNNDVAMLPPELGRMTTLRALPLMGNPIRGYSSAVINGPISILLAKLRHRLEDEDSRPGADDAVAADMLSLAISSNGTTLCLANKDLCQVPEQVWDQGMQLKQLDLSNNKLQQLPAGRLARLSGLQTLLLPRNQLLTWPLPSGLGALPHLQELSVAYSFRSPVPEDAFQACMTSLTCLDLSGVPAPLHRGCLGGLTALKSLVWEKASLALFPADIPQLTALQTLSLMSNDIAEVPDTITQLTALTLLNISNCNIASLPPQLGLLKTLRTVMLEGNPLRTIRRSILEKGTKAVLEYLEDRIPTSPEVMKSRALQSSVKSS